MKDKVRKETDIIIENYIKSIFFYEKEIANNIYKYLSDVQLLSKLDETQIKFYSLWFLNGKIFEQSDFKKTNKEEVKKEIDKLMYDLSLSYYDVNSGSIGLFEEIRDECENQYIDINDNDKKEYQNSKNYLSSEIRITQEPKIIKNLISFDNLHPSLQLFFKNNKLINKKESYFKYFAQSQLKEFDIVMKYFNNIFISEKQGAQLSFEFSLLEIAEFNLVQQSIIKLNERFKKIDKLIEELKITKEKKEFKINDDYQEEEKMKMEMKMEMEMEESDGEQVIKQLGVNDQQKLLIINKAIPLLASDSRNNPGGGAHNNNNVGGIKIPIIVDPKIFSNAVKIAIDHVKNVAFTVLASFAGIIVSGLTLYLITNAKKEMIEDSYDNNNFTNSSTNTNYSVNSSKSNPASSIPNEDSVTNYIYNNMEEHAEELLLEENDYDEHYNYNNNGENINLGDLI